MEIWKDIEGWEGYYQVSTEGRVRSLPRTVASSRCTSNLKGRILKPRPDPKGYMKVALCRDGICYSRKVHRLVAQAFIPNPDNLATVNHKDEVKSNNRLENLEWLSNADNTAYGTRGDRIRQKLSQPIIGTKDGKDFYFSSISSAAKHFDGTSANIISALKGKYKQAFGYTWRYAEKKEG